MAYFSKVALKHGVDGSTGALVAYLARTADSVGQSHHLVWSLFGNRDGRRPFLFRMTGRSPREPILIYSTEKPEDGHGLWDIECRDLTASFAAGRKLAFNVRVNPVVSRPAIGKDGAPVLNRKGMFKTQKHDIVMNARFQGDRRPWDEIAASVVPPWIAKTFGRIGLEAAAGAMSVENYARHRFADGKGGSVTVRTVDVAGIGTVTDPGAFEAGLLQGIGDARSYGCGMILARPAS